MCLRRYGALAELSIDLIDRHESTYVSGSGIGAGVGATGGPRFLNLSAIPAAAFFLSSNNLAKSSPDDSPDDAGGGGA